MNPRKPIQAQALSTRRPCWNYLDDTASEVTNIGGLDMVLNGSKIWGYTYSFQKIYGKWIIIYVFARQSATQTKP